MSSEYANQDAKQDQWIDDLNNNLSDIEKLVYKEYFGLGELDVLPKNDEDWLEFVNKIVSSKNVCSCEVLNIDYDYDDLIKKIAEGNQENIDAELKHIKDATIEHTKDLWNETTSGIAMEVESLNA